MLYLASGILSLEYFHNFHIVIPPSILNISLIPTHHIRIMDQDFIWCFNMWATVSITSKGSLKNNRCRRKLGIENWKLFSWKFLRKSAIFHNLSSFVRAAPSVTSLLASLLSSQHLQHSSSTYPVPAWIFGKSRILKFLKMGNLDGKLSTCLPISSNKRDW